MLFALKTLNDLVSLIRCIHIMVIDCKETLDYVHFTHIFAASSIEYCNKFKAQFYLYIGRDENKTCNSIVL